MRAARGIRDRLTAASNLRLTVRDIGPDELQVIASGFERSFGIMVRNKSGVLVKGFIALPAETIKDDQQPSMFLVDPRAHEIDDGDVGQADFSHGIHG